MKKHVRSRILSVLLAVVLLMSLLSVTALADGITYLDENGAEKTCDNATAVGTSTAWGTTNNKTWYVVNSNVTINERVTVTGDVHLILADGCMLNAKKGISVTSGNSLTIYGQSKGTGELTARAYQLSGYAGIGGQTGNDAAHGSITINGGIIKAESVNQGAGIGSGYGAGASDKTNGTITINGGRVTATGKGEYGAGIGGGYFNKISGGNIEINGGTVIADGAKWAAGIGTGYGDQQKANGRSITISGSANVTAIGGEWAAGIGGGYACGGKCIRSITINGSANVTANGGERGAGIGSGYGSTSNMTTTITIGGSAVVKATGGDDEDFGGAGIGSGGASGGIGNININGGTVTATGGTATDPSTAYSGAGIGSGGNSKSWDKNYNLIPATGKITINAGTITATGGAGAASIGDGKGGMSGDFATDRKVNGAPVPGKAVIYASSITDKDDTTGWKGIIFEGNEGQVYGTITLQKDLTLVEDQTLTVPADSKLIVPANKKLVVEEGAELIIEDNGTLTNRGTITVEGGGMLSGKPVGKGEVKIAPTITTVSPLPNGEVGKEYSLELEATGDDTITWGLAEGSSMPAGLTLSEDGKISGTPTAVDEYTFTVTATNDHGSNSKELTLIINAVPVTSVTLDKTSLDLTVGDSATLNAKVEPENATYPTVIWTSSNPNVATVDSTGKVTALKPGTTTITAKADGKTATCTVTVSREPVIPEPNGITVTQPANGTIKVNPSNGSADTLITVTATPDEGYELAYITVDGEKISGNTFRMPDKAVTVSAVFVTSDFPFVDVKPGDWHYDYIAYVYENGLMNGVSATTFEPNANMTRAMVWTILARIDGETVTGANWIDTARAWAMAEGVSDGTDPNGLVTREQFATMLYRYAVAKGYDVSIGESTNILSYADYDEISEWAIPAMQWACGSGIITGVTESTLVPQGTATRAQCAAMLMRFVEL